MKHNYVYEIYHSIMYIDYTDNLYWYKSYEDILYMKYIMSSCILIILITYKDVNHNLCTEHIKENNKYVFMIRSYTIWRGSSHIKDNTALKKGLMHKKGHILSHAKIN